MIIRIRSFTNRIYIISVNSNDTVKTIKDKIQEAEGISLDQQNLIFLGKELKDEYFISDYKIRGNSTINLVLKLRYGRYNSIKENPIEEEKRIKEKEEKKLNFIFDFEGQSYSFSYDQNMTIKEMLTDFLSKINSKDTPEEFNFMYNSYLLCNHFSKKIKEIFRPYIGIFSSKHFVIKIIERGKVMGGNKWILVNIN